MATAAQYYYTKPIFRPAVEYLVGDLRAVFRYDTVSFDIDCNEHASVEISRLCDLLTSGVDLSTLPSAFGDFETHAWNIIEALDRYGFLTDGAPPDLQQVISGAAFWKEVSAFVERAKVKSQPVLYEALRSGRADRHALIRYAIEYFHIVRAGPQIIAGSLAHTQSNAVRAILEDFLGSELGHDRILLRALSAVGIGEDRLHSALPLPETFSLISALQVFADQEPLTFMALVFLLEEASPEFNKEFLSACVRCGLGDDFSGPIIRHAAINDAGDHGGISARLLNCLPLVTTEERIVVLKQAAVVVENLVALEHAILGERHR
jgi:hypothetical protein